MSRVGLLLRQMDEVYDRLRRRLEGLTGGEIGCLRDLYRVAVGGP